MRLSVKKDDKGYHKMARLYQPYLNGNPVSHCFTADEDLGIVMCHKCGENGKIVLNDEKTEIIEEIFSGIVEIKLKKNG